MGNLPEGIDKGPPSVVFYQMTEMLWQRVVLAVSRPAWDSHPRALTGPQGSGPQDRRGMHAVGTCSTDIFTTLLPTTERTLTRTHQSYDTENLYLFIHTYTVC